MMDELEFQRVFNLPFAEAEAFFRDKLNIPTGKWDELAGAAHAKGFMSAGAYQADLLSDLRAMTDKAISGGMDIREFRTQFRPLVEKYGWQLKGGGPAWRSDLIWRTNIQSAYQAGRWQQFEAAKIEYLLYRHNDSVMHPRPNHVALNGKVFPRTDPFWEYNYPPQGFGCKCRAVPATEKEYNEGDNLRPQGYEDMADKGWGYNVGLESQVRHEDMLGQKLAKMEPAIAGYLLESLKKELAPGNDRRWAKWIEDIHANTTATGVIKTTGEMKTVWFVEPDIAEALQKAGGPELSTSLITATDRALLHTEHLQDLSRGEQKTVESQGKRKARPAERIVGLEHIKALPKLVREPQAVLYDTQEKGLLYVFAVDVAAKSGKWAVRVNLMDKKSKMVTNALRTGAFVKTTNLQEEQYTLLKGRL